MGNCWPKRKVDYSQKRDRIKMWVESVSQPNMEELRSIQEQGETNLVRIPAVSNLSALSPALTISRTTSISSSVIFFDAREYFDSEDEESAYDDAIFQEVVGDRAQWGGSLEKRTGSPGKKDFKGFILNLCGDCCDKLRA